MAGKIEFRVQGKDSPQVAEELAHRLRTRFKANPVVQRESPAVDGASGQKFDPNHILFVVHLAVVSFEAYKTFVHEPREEERKALVKKWEDLIDWARTKLPTKILALIGTESLFLDEGEADRLHRLTKKALDQVSVVPE